MTDKKVKIAIADDHQMFIDGIKSLLIQHERFEWVGEASNGLELLELLERKPADLVLMDIAMPLMDGIEATKQIQKKHKQTKVIALSMHMEKEFISRILKAGAWGYVLKNIGKEELIRAIDTVISGESHICQEASNQLLNSFLNKKTVGASAEQVNISKRERQVLQCICEEHTTQEIAERLFISKNTVETHRKNLLIKLNVRNTAGLVRVALEKSMLEER